MDQKRANDRNNGNLSFIIVYKNGSRRYHLEVECIWQGEEVEEFRVEPAIKSSKFIILQNNRPLLRKKLRLRHKRINWRVIHGTINNITALDEVIALIEAKLEPL